MTPVPTMNTAAREIPSELMPSIGTGCASTNVAASRSATTPPRTAALGPDAANQNIATPSSAKPTRAVGRRIGRRRAVSRETKRARLTSPAALSKAGFAKRAECPGEAIHVPAGEGNGRHTLPGRVDHPAAAQIDARVVDLRGPRARACRAEKEDVGRLDVSPGDAGALGHLAAHLVGGAALDDR